jgi:uncharacterized repeat protein (TIGR03803 family)
VLRGRKRASKEKLGQQNYSKEVTTFARSSRVSGYRGKQRERTRLKTHIFLFSFACFSRICVQFPPPWGPGWGGTLLTIPFAKENLMASSKSHRSWIFGTSRRATTAALAMALALTVVPTPAAHAQTFTVLHSFTNGQDGAHPEAGLTIDRAGNLYGTAFYGGLGPGTVFKLTHKSSGWTFNPLYSFPANEGQGANPQARVIFGPNGTLYGTTEGGGNPGGGVVFNLSPPATVCKSVLCPWTERVLHNFPAYPGDGGRPGSGDLVFDQARNLYGTTILGGSAGLGAVYKLTPSGEESVLYSFAGGNDGSTPWSGVIFDGSGNLYGTTTEGGEGCLAGCGTVYKMTPSGSGWTETPIYRFTGGSDGAAPYGGLIFDQFGNLYGTTISGGIRGDGGTVFELTPNSDGSWSFSLLYSFTGNGGPNGSLTMDAARNLYGLTAENDCPGCSTYGDVFELTPSGGGWTYINLHPFLGGYDDGVQPYGSVVLDASGNIYGTAYGWGQYGYGIVWEITP